MWDLGEYPMRRWLLAATLALAPSAAGAQLYWQDPAFAGAAVTGAEPGISLPIPGATPEEYSAALIWNLRAALNVAALSCQPWPFLDPIDNYNSMLVDHSDELKPAYENLQKYFVRTHGQREGMRRFDDYNTKTYNGFSTLYAKLGFCQVAGDVGKQVRFAPRGGGLLAVARNRMREVRNSLTPAADMFFAVPTLGPVVPNIPVLAANCFKRDGSVKSSCR